MNPSDLTREQLTLREWLVTSYLASQHSDSKNDPKKYFSQILSAYACALALKDEKTQRILKREIIDQGYPAELLDERAEELRLKIESALTPTENRSRPSGLESPAELKHLD